MGLKPRQSDRDSEHPLIRAIRAVDLAQVRRLLDSGQSARDPIERKPPLNLASQIGSAEIAALLIERGAEVDARETDRWNEPGFTALHTAAKFGHPAIARLLLDAGADPNHPEFEHKTDDEGFGYTEEAERPLHIAASVGQLAVTELLVDAGAEIDPIYLGRTPLSCAAGGAGSFPISDGHLAVVRCLASKGAAIGGNPFSSSSSSLHEAVRASSVPMVRLLIELGARLSPNGLEFEEAAERSAEFFQELIASVAEDDPNRKRNFDTGLVAAARNGRAEIVAALLSAGADVNAASDSGRTALHWNAIWGKGQRLAVFDALTSSGANLNALDSDRVSPLVFAVAGKFSDLVTRFIDAGAELNPADVFPPLFQAAHDGNSEIAELLLAGGANRAIQFDGKGAEHWARASGHTALADKLAT